MERAGQAGGPSARAGGARAGRVVAAIVMTLAVLTGPTAAQRTAAASRLDAATLGMPEVQLTGRLVDPHGEPVCGVPVWVVPNRRVLERAGVPMDPYRQGMILTAQHLRGVRLRDMPADTTNAAGAFRLRLPHVPLGPSFEALGPPTPVLVAAAPGLAVHAQALRLPDERAWDLGEVRLRPQRVLRGRVLDVHGAPIAAARVAVVRQTSMPTGLDGDRPWLDALLPELHETRSDPEGRFELWGVWPSRLTLRIGAPGFATIEERVLDPSVREIDAPLVLARGARLAGHVLDAAGVPVAGVEVLAVEEVPTRIGAGCVVTGISGDDDRAPLEWWTAQSRAQVFARTDASGRFVLRGLRARPHALFARSAEHGFARQPVAHSDGHDALLVFPPVARQLLELVDVDVDADAPVPGAWIGARRLTGNQVSPPLHVRSGDASHVYEIVGVGAHGLFLEIRAPGRAITRLRLPGLAPGATARERVALAPGGVVRVRLVDDTGAPVPRARVRLTEWFTPGAELPLGFIGEEVWTGSTGAATFAGLPAKRYVVSAWHPDLEPGSSERRFVDVDVHAGAAHEVELPMIRDARARGR